MISGPGYHNNRGGLSRMRRFLAGVPELRHEEVSTPEDVEQALRRFRENSVRLVVVNGGDGTLSMVVTEVMARRARGDEPPLLAVLEGGRTNMSAGDFGCRGRPTRALDRILRWVERGGNDDDVVERAVIRLTTSSGSPSRCGFFVGAGIIYHGSKGCWTFRETSVLPGSETGLGTALGVAGILGKLLVGKAPYPPVTVGITADGVDLGERRWVAILATTLERMALGIRPFWGPGDGPMRITGIPDPPRGVFLSAPWSLRGRPCRWTSPERGYSSVRARTAVLAHVDGVTLDGELIQPEDGQPIRLDATESLRFLRT